MMAAERAQDAPFDTAHQLNGAVTVIEHSHRSGLGADNEGSGMAWFVRDASPTADAFPVWRMQTAPYDVVAPNFDKRMLVPSSARVGQTICMAAPARDRWTGATVTWDFGDGATEEGETLTYA